MQDMNPTGFSSPEGILWDSTAQGHKGTRHMIGLGEALDGNEPRLWMTATASLPAEMGLLHAGPRTMALYSGAMRTREKVLSPGQAGTYCNS